MVKREVTIMTNPTINMMVLGFINLSKYAPIGAARTPPTINPRIVFQLWNPRKNKNTPVLAKATKNSAVLTVPIVSFGVFPR